MVGKAVIIGAAAGGVFCAVRLRRLSEDIEIILIEKNPCVFSELCGFFGHGVFSDGNSLLLQKPEDFKRKFNIEVRMEQEVISINRKEKMLEIKNLLADSYYQETYDKLVLNLGSKIVEPTGRKENHVEHVYSFRSISDMDPIIMDLENNKSKHVTIVGGGLIALEMIEMLHHKGLGVSVLEPSEQVISLSDLDMANYIHQEMLRKKIELRFRVGLESIQCSSSNNHSLDLFLTDGNNLATDMVILVADIKPDIGLAQSAGIVIGEEKGIRVNKMMQTNDVDIFAVGDTIETFDFVTQKPTLVTSSGLAFQQGRIAADNIVSRKTKYYRSQGALISKLFGTTFARIGLTEKQLLKEKKHYFKINLHSDNYEDYRSDAQMISLKLLFQEETGLILGAQAFGQVGVDKCMDILAVSQRAGLTVRDLAHLELCTSIFISGRDIVNVAGTIASNLLDDDVKLIYAENLLEQQKKGITILDVRDPNELEKASTLPKTVNIPLTELRERIGELDKGREYVTACQTGMRGYLAYRFLVKYGFRVSNLDGGYQTFQSIHWKLAH